ncbi:MAG TPA: hypothetical protein VKQ30_20695 [Ktedonobacterales bacterium]|nr:hypothetical protein [Ktedonobacterales bacterium]
MLHVAPFSPGATPWWDDKMWAHPLPRIIRFAPPRDLPGRVIAKVDRVNNVVTINQEVFEQQDKFTQRKLLRAHFDVTSV